MLALLQASVLCQQGPHMGRGAETKYLKIEKLAYALLIAAWKLHHYLQAHPIAVLTDQPLKQNLQRPDTLRWLLKCSIELSEFHISYQPRMAIKAQILADFIVEFTHDVTLDPEMEALEEQSQEDELARLKLFLDGSSN